MITASRLGPFLLAGVVLCGNGCRNQPPPNVLLVTLDTLRADHVGYTGSAKAATPNLDALARRGTAFRDALASIPITLPSHASMMYGLPPDLLQNYNNGQPLPEEREYGSLAERFQKDGYTTAAFVSLGVLAKRYGLDRGFDLYDSDFPAERWYLDASEVNRRALPWLEKTREKKFFAWIHYSDPHDPYAPPDSPDDLTLLLNGKEAGRFCLAKYLTYELDLDLRAGENVLVWKIDNAYPENAPAFHARFDRLEFSPAPPDHIRKTFDSLWEARPEENLYFAKTGARLSLWSDQPRRVHLTFTGRPLWSLAGIRAMYRREVEFLDRELGKLWEKITELGLWKTTVVIAAGDHGEGLGEFISATDEPHVGHIHYLYSYYLRIPLIIVDPRQPGAGQIRDDPASLLDLAPTIARLAGFQRSTAYRGRDLMAGPAPAEREIFTETYRPEAWLDRFGLRRYPWHLILTPQEEKLEVYDLRTDPAETRNLAGNGKLPVEVLPLYPELEARAREILKGKVEIKIDKKTEEMLRALGYIK